MTQIQPEELSLELAIAKYASMPKYNKKSIAGPEMCFSHLRKPNSQLDGSYIETK